MSNSVWEKAWRRAWQSLVRIQPCAVAKLIIRIIRDEEETGRENLYKNRCLYGPVAQLGEHMPCKHEVACSTHVRSTKTEGFNNSLVSKKEVLSK